MNLTSRVCFWFCLGITAVVVTHGHPPTRKVCFTKILNSHSKVSIKNKHDDQVNVTEVSVLQTYSKQKCILNWNYGFYGSHVYTKDCKAKLKVCYRKLIDIGCRVVTLSSTSHEPNKIVFKKGKIYKMELLRHLQDSKMCKRGFSFDYLRNSAWSMKGCKAQFKVCIKKNSGNHKSRNDCDYCIIQQ
ncbi:lectin ADEL-like [Biomphalaria glabrata]|uniref:Lectin ADEL-like n=1 Tax=Biomphalaria glabrata TaxID=6526 RepID=A0A9W3ARZ8_BIOGL|nr:lectin ADEL-like [Biomphalaria glabrata]